MLRRGLHGAKNWVLEPDEDGIPRGPWVKLMRAAVVLAPLWIVLSAVTGGPERGGRQISVWQALLTAVLVALGGLAFLSARERRLGREEPWADLPDLGTRSDDSERETKVDPAPEAPTEVLENQQVSETSSETEVVTPGDIPDVSDQTSQISSDLATQVVTPLAETAHKEASESPFVQVGRGDHGDMKTLVQVATRPARDLGSEGANPQIPDALELDNPTVPLAAAKSGGNPVIPSFDERGNPQVRAGDQVAINTTPSRPEWSSLTVTEGDNGAELAPHGEAVTTVATNPIQEELFPQVSLDKDVVTPPETSELQAEQGPYEVTEAPMAGDWFLTKPDVEPEEEPEAAPEPEPDATSRPESHQVPEPPGEEKGSSGIDPAVLVYRALQGMPNVSEEEKEAARRNAIEWVRREVPANRQSQRSAGLMLGVSKTTIANWLGRDPWADAEDE
jgi:hypothetical protein